MKKFNWKQEKWMEVVFLLLLFIGLLVWTVLQPLGSTPDETMRYSICRYIFVHGNLPHGGDPEILDHTWGFSYAFQPIFPYMVSTVFMKIAAFVIEENFWLLLSARLVNVINGVIMAYFIFRIGEKIFTKKTTKWMFICLVALWPQGMFVHTYVNTDSMALMSTAVMMYAWILGIETAWNRKSCILLSIGISLCALSYYNAYGFILSSMILFFFYFYKRVNGKIRLEWNPMLKKGLFITLLVFVMIGWWFIRSAVLYHGDFLGLQTRNEYAEIYARNDLKPSIHATYLKQGYSILYMLMHSNFIILTCRSFIAMFGNMSLGIYNWIYRVYYGIIVLSFIGLWLPTKRREYLKQMSKDKVSLLYVCFALSILIPNALNLWAAYSYDYQPQGRYSLPMLLPLVYFITVGMHKVLTFLLKREALVSVVEIVVSLFVILVAFLSIHDFILPTYYNTFMEWYKLTLVPMLKINMI